jgi:hypothetical protein
VKFALVSSLQDAKNKAIQSINKALADKLNDIDNANATEQDKILIYLLMLY